MGRATVVDQRKLQLSAIAARDDLRVRREHVAVLSGDGRVVKVLPTGL